jgi:hypothetical protein
MAAALAALPTAAATDEAEAAVRSYLALYFEGRTCL